MKARWILLLSGLAFAVTLAVIVGQRLSAEAMAVMVGVVAGVAASIPTSLVVVWFATRSMHSVHAAPAVPAPAPEPRLVYLPQPAAGAYAGLMQYSAPALPGLTPLPFPLPLPAAAQRQFNVIGGVELAGAEAEEAVWRS